MNENNLEKIINNIFGDAIVKEVMSLKLAVKQQKWDLLSLLLYRMLQEDLSLFIAWMVLIMAASMLQ